MNKSKVPVTNINLPDLPLFKTGKVRSVFDFGDQLLLVASDRVSAFDFILDQGIPHKAEVLTSISEFWFDKFNDSVAHHLISTDVKDFPEAAQKYADILEGRTMLVKKTELIPFECVVRGYIIGSGWKDYQKTGQVCGHQLPESLQLAAKLEEPLFTPATKRDDHDENVSVAYMRDKLGQELTDKLQALSLDIYSRARDFADNKGIIIADTKFEFGLLDGEIILIDEVLTPDSSRFWSKAEYREGISPPSFDKQIVRDYLSATGWDKLTPPPPALTPEIIRTTSQSYLDIQKLLTH
ncbi:phosphoribosylaminoimidazolesuccinocarboxamide synthase [bacterium]|jgi:phosphoribosylaminoimidazole-succinocarboxamide synthase|nr:phosphoribosylaminoimidazolesuccinocarboxamide synthase [bacterium]